MNVCQSVYVFMTIPNHFFWRHNWVHKLNIICLSETYFYSTVPLDDGDWAIPGYSLVCSDHLPNTKRRGVCLYCKNYLPLSVINIDYLKEWTLSIWLTINGVTFLSFIGTQFSPKMGIKSSLITLKWH